MIRSESVSIDIIDYYNQVRNKKRVPHKLANEIKQLFKKFQIVFLKFPEALTESFEIDEMVASLLYNLSKKICYEDFKTRLNFEYPNMNLNINPYAQKMFQHKEVARKKLYIKLCITAIAICMIFYSFITKNSPTLKIYNEAIEKYSPTIRIEHKIQFLIKKYNITEANLNLSYTAQAIQEQEQKYAGESENLILSVIMQESRFNHMAAGPVVDSSGDRCKGLMQLYLLYWGKYLPDNNFDLVWDERDNIRIGCFALNDYITSAKGDIKKALVLYNGGYNYTSTDGNGRTIIVGNYDSDAYVAAIFTFMNQLEAEFK